MPRPIILFVRYVDAMNKAVGKFAMYLIFVMGGVLLFESISRTIFDKPHIWVVEIAQFTMAAYYLLGGGYSLMLGGHVRMDLLYGRWTKRGQAISDLLTAPLFFFYMVLLLIGAISSIHYAVTYGQTNYTPWAPPLSPIKIIMGIGILLMLLEGLAYFFKDLARARGLDVFESTYIEYNPDALPENKTD